MSSQDVDDARERELVRLDGVIRRREAEGGDEAERVVARAMAARAVLIAERDGPVAATPLMVAAAARLEGLDSCLSDAVTASALIRMRRWLGRFGEPDFDRDGQFALLEPLVEELLAVAAQEHAWSFINAVDDVAGWMWKHDRLTDTVELVERITTWVDEHEPENGEILLAMAANSAIGVLYEDGEYERAMALSERSLAALSDPAARTFDPSVNMIYALTLKMRAYSLAVLGDHTSARATWLRLILEFQDTDDADIARLVTEARDVLDYPHHKPARKRILGIRKRTRS